MSRLRPGRLRRAAPWWALAACWAGAIFWFSSHSGSQLPKSWLLSHDKLCHGAEYGLLGALLGMALLRSGLAGLRLVAAATLIGGLYGASDEYHQSFVPGRQGNDPFDLAADVTGTALGSVAAAVVLLRAGVPHAPPPEENPA